MYTLTILCQGCKLQVYDHQFRLEILKSAINAHDKITRSVKGRKYIEGDNGGETKEELV